MVMVDSAIAGDTCYTVDMTDTYGDGWNGGAIEVYEDGVMMQSVTLATGFSGSEDYCGTEDAVIEFYFVEGSWTGEIGYDILDPNGDPLVSVTAGMQPKLVWRPLRMLSLSPQLFQTVMMQMP